MGLLDFFRREKPDPETERRRLLTAFGRIVEGTILEEQTSVADHVYFTYNVNGSDYHTSEKLTAEQIADGIKYAPGAKVSIRYDPGQPANSILI